MHGASPAPGPWLEREIWSTPGEFVRGLHVAFPGGVECIGDGYRAHWNGTTMTVELKVLEPRVIGRLSMPSLRVRIGFAEPAAESSVAMLRYFDLATHRGGG